MEYTNSITPDQATPPERLLFVDLDGTLLLTDSLWETFLSLCTHQPGRAFRAVLVAATRGIAPAKHFIAEQAHFDADAWPIHEEVLDFLKRAHQSGTSIVLATAAHHRIAQRIQKRVSLFTDVLASDGLTNLKADAKCRAILGYASGRPFGYIGNDRSDICIWKKATRAYLVDRVPKGRRMFSGISFTRVFLKPSPLSSLPTLMRAHQWFKNFLIFVPLLLAHQFFDITVWEKSLVAFVSFSLCASSVYIFNDMLDVAHDRRHPLKRQRPFASGLCSFPQGLFLCAGASLLAYGLGFLFLGSAIPFALLAYQAVALLYSAWLKRLALIDIFILALFYSYRLALGSWVTGIHLSHWLLGFSLFFFLSLALLKRYAELALMGTDHARGGLSGRDYTTEDAHVLTMAGVASAFASSLVLVLYIQSEEVRALYHHPSFLWGVSLCVLFWLLRLWMLASRRRVNDDPLLFSLKDPGSFILIAVIVAVSLLAAA